MYSSQATRPVPRSGEPFVDFLLDLLWGQECILTVQVELSLHHFGTIELALDAALHVLADVHENIDADGGT